MVKHEVELNYGLESMPKKASIYMEELDSLFGITPVNTEGATIPLRHFVTQARKGVPEYVEMLYGDVVETSPLFTPLVDRRSLFLSKEYYKRLWQTAHGFKNASKVPKHVFLDTLRHYFYLSRYLTIGEYDLRLTKEEIEDYGDVENRYEYIPTKHVDLLIYKLESLDAKYAMIQAPDIHSLNKIVIKMYGQLYYTSPDAIPSVYEAKTILKKAKKKEKLTSAVTPITYETMSYEESKQLKTVEKVVKSAALTGHVPEIFWAALAIAKAHPNMAMDKILTMAIAKWGLDITV